MSATTIITGSKLNDRLQGSDLEDTIDAGSGDDIVSGSAGADVIDGGDGFDVLDYRGSKAGVRIDLPSGKLSGGDAEGDKAVDIESYMGSDGGDDLFIGGADDDRFSGWAGDDVASGGDGNDQIDGGIGDDRLAGEAGNDFLVGGAGNDTIDGGEGDDHVKGGAGRDVLIGGKGTDTVDYAASAAAVTIDLAAGVAKGGDADGDVLSEFEIVIGSAVGGDTLTGSAGDDRLHGLGGADTLSGGDGSDELEGGAGNDRIVGGAGVDFVSFTGLISEYVITNNGDGSITVTDRVAGRDGADIVLGDVENLRFSDTVALTGDYNGAFNKTLTGTTGADRLLGGRGVDSMLGGTGDDILVGSLGADTLNGGTGNDVADYRNSFAAVGANLSTGLGTGGTAQGDRYASIEHVYGSAFGDTITGNSGANWLTGFAGDDTIDGGSGNDVLIGGMGADSLKGGSGIDTASYVASSAAVNINFATGLGTGGDAQGDRFNTIERLIGSNFADTFTGTATAELFAGRGGNDTVSAGGGNDVVYGEEGNDSISGGDGDDDLAGDAGDDVVRGDAGNDVLRGDDGADTLDGGTGFDTVDYSQSLAGISVDLTTGVVGGGFAQGDKLVSIERIVGTRFADIVAGSSAAEMLDGLAGNDVLSGAAGNDSLSGGLGNDTLSGGLGDDVAGGGDGDDIVRGDDGLDFLTGGAGRDLIEAGAGNDQAYGDEGDDTVDGGAGNDLLSGGDGSDVILGGIGDDGLTGGAGADLLDGGAGSDWADYRTSVEGVDVSLVTGTGKGGDAEGDLLVNIERVQGSDAADRLTSGALGEYLSGNGGDDLLTGNAGMDQLDGRDGKDTLDGGTEADFLDGGDGDDLIMAGTGSDQILGGSGADRNFGDDGYDLMNYANSPWAVRADLTAGRGWGGWAEGDTYTSIEQIYGSVYFSDVLTGAGIGEKLYGFGGNDQLNGMAGNDSLYGGNGNDVLDGGADADQLWGDAGNDSLSGGDGADKLYGGDGNDVLIGGTGLDTLDGEAGTDTADYAGSNAAVVVNLALGTGLGGTAQYDILRNIENLTGSNFADVLTGSDAANYIRGGAGNDTMRAGSGNDVIEGGAGADIVDGGSGSDRAVYSGSGSAVSIDLATGLVSGGDAAGDALVEIEHLTGSNGADMLSGNDVGNDLVGGRGADTLSGAGGNDALEGGRDNDVLSGGAGTDTARFSASAADYDIELTSGVYSISDTRGISTGDGSDSLSTVEVAAFSDRSVNLADLRLGTALNDNLSGTSGNDIIFANAGDDQVLAGDGDDLVVAGDGADTVLAGNGNDIVNAGRGNDTIDAGTGNDSVRAGTGADTVLGGAGSDSIYGESGSDLVDGGDNNDTLDGGAGDDVVKGGAGDDIMYGDNSVNLVRNGGFETVTTDAFTVEPGLIRLESLDSWTSVNGAYFELIKGSNAGSAPTEGTYALDMAEAMQAMDITQDVGGLTAGDAFLLTFDAGSRSAATTSMQVYWNGELIDTVRPSGTTAQRYAYEVTAGSGDGSDRIEFREVGSSTVIGVTLDNVSLFAIGNDSMEGGNGNDQLYAGAGNDVLAGGGGNDTLDGQGGTDMAVFTGRWQDYRITQLADGRYQVSDSRSGNPDGTDTLANVEVAQFSDGKLTAAELLQQAPVDIAVSASTVLENAAGGTVVGKLSAVDANVADSLTYQLTSGTDRFVIVGDTLSVKSGAVLNYESAAFHNITVKVTDAGGNAYSETIKINVGNVNETPTGLALTGGSVTEGAAAGTLVGTLSSSDVDAGDTRTYAIVGGSKSFEIAGSNLVVAKGAVLDFETAAKEDVLIRVTDAGGLSTEQTFTIGVANASGFVTGTSGADKLVGTSEEDTIVGGQGGDSMSGGAGKDTFVWNTADLEKGSVDRITDFGAYETIDFSRIRTVDGQQLNSVDDVMVTETEAGALVSVDTGAGFVDVVMLEGTSGLSVEAMLKHDMLLL